ncbi:alpha/beta hydrolase [Halomonas sp. BC04]|uniref:alpha/beta hydrolase n=1 Tax=Halomonas sp. BC04 TaxID=1403540 RepID=UPI000684F122|nr:alpha/beta hydrolase [Halomonas sp. BC04]
MSSFGGLRRLLLAVTASLPLLASGGCAITPLTSPAPLTSATQDTPAQPPYTFQRLSRQTYTPADWPEPLGADIYLPDTPGQTRRPAALVVHGGGWQNRSPQDMRGIAERLASEGFVVANVQYRFAPTYPFPAQLHDLQQAMAWLHRKADEDDWRIDTDRIVGVGYSSGAHLVSLLALKGAVGTLSQPYGGEHARLAAVLAGGTPSDLFKFDDGRLVVEFLGGKRAEVPEQYELASPARHISPDAPPFFLFHGTWDRLVPVDHATDFHALLQQAGIESELYRQPLRGHITSFLTSGRAIGAGIDFLRRQGLTPALPPG